MAGQGITGRDGDARISATQICEVTKWSFNPKVNIVSYASNKTGGFKQKIAGIKEGTGTLEGVWDPANPAYATVYEGVSDVSLRLYITATQFWQITGIIESFQNDVNIDAGELVTWTASFHSRGQWTGPVAALMLPDDPEGLSLMGIDDKEKPVFTPDAPLMREGETVVQALARLDAHYQKMSLPGWMDDMVARVASQLKAAQAHMWTPEGFEEAIAKASEKAAVKLNDGIVAATADAVIYRLRDILPPYSKAAA